MTTEQRPIRTRAPQALAASEQPPAAPSAAAASPTAAPSAPPWVMEIELSKPTRTGVTALKFRRPTAGAFIAISACEGNVAMTEAFIARCADRTLTMEEIGELPTVDSNALGEMLLAVLSDAQAGAGGKYSKEDRRFTLAHPMVTNLFTMRALVFKNPAEVTFKQSQPVTNAADNLTRTREFIKVWARIEGAEDIPLTSKLVEDMDAGDFLAIGDTAMPDIRGNATAWRRL